MRLLTNLFKCVLKQQREKFHNRKLWISLEPAQMVVHKKSNEFRELINKTTKSRGQNFSQHFDDILNL